MRPHTARSRTIKCAHRHRPSKKNDGRKAFGCLGCPSVSKGIWVPWMPLGVERHFGFPDLISATAAHARWRPSFCRHQDPAAVLPGRYTGDKELELADSVRVRRPTWEWHLAFQALGMSWNAEIIETGLYAVKRLPSLFFLSNSLDQIAGRHS